MSRSTNLWVVVQCCAWFLLALGAVGDATFADGPEFILGAAFFDILHPAGFPLYSQLTSPFMLLPVGPIAWRVNVGSAFWGALVITLTAMLVSRFLVRDVGWDRRPAALLGLGGASLLLLSPSFVRQAITPEAYMLSTALILGTLLLVEQAFASRDARWLLSAAFLGGLSLCNHVASVLALAPVALLSLIMWRSNFRLVIAGLVAALVGLAVYTAIAVRTFSPVSLNTGAPDTLARFEALLTNERDRVLRPEAPLLLSGSSEGATLQTVRADAEKMAAELPPWLWGLALLGVVASFRSSPRSTLALVFVGGGTWFFFRGWSPDPWMPLFAVTCIFSAAAAGWMLSLIKGAPKRQIAYVVALACLVSSLALTRLPLSHEARRFTGAADIVRSELRAMPPNAVWIVDNNWFLAKYLRDVEGLRPDVVLVHHPELIAPRYFRRIALRDEKRESFKSPDDGQAFGALLSFAASRVPVVLEPNPESNKRLANVMNLGADGRIRLIPGKTLEVSPEFTRAWLRRANNALAAMRDFPLLLLDGVNHIDMAAVQAADALMTAQSPGDAVELLGALCAERTPPCSLIAENNYGVALLRNGDAQGAASLFMRLLREKKGSRHEGALRANLELALAKLSSSAEDSGG